MLSPESRPSEPLTCRVLVDYRCAAEMAELANAQRDGELVHYRSLKDRNCVSSTES
jgi:hypothetical protein